MTREENEAITAVMAAIPFDHAYLMVVRGLERMAAGQVVEALTESVSDLDLRLVANHLAALALECDPVEPEADPGSVHHGDVDERRLAAELIAEAKARRNGGWDGDDGLDWFRRAVAGKGGAS